MATITIDFNKVIAWSKANCFTTSHHKCAGYVKNAFVAGGCKYVQGNGFCNQNFCQTNDFKCVGDFSPVGANPRNGMQFPQGYKQQTGDICLLTHNGGVGHMCYAYGPGINDWVSDYWQGPPGTTQQPGTGPYCYSSGITRVQFWRHSSVMNGAPEVTVQGGYSGGGIGGDFVSSPTPSSNVPGVQGTVEPQKIKSMGPVVSTKYSMVLGTHIRQS